MDLRLLKIRPVRDLGWALTQPPPFNTIPDFNKEWLQNDLYDQGLYSWLQNLDQNPTTLLEHLQQQRSRRLGIYFEQLLSFYFEHYPRFELLGKNVQVNGNKRTLGEFDFIINDLSVNKIYHIEVAIKFYLGHQYLLKDIEGNNPYYNWHHWLGPNKKDTLGKKMAHLKSHQLTLSETDSGKSALKPILKKDEAINVRLLLCGRFFFPINNKIETPQHCQWLPYQHHWLSLHNAKHSEELMKNDKQLIVLPRAYWLSELTYEDLSNNKLVIRNYKETLKWIEQQKEFSEWLLVEVEAEINNNNKAIKEIRRIFIIDN
jgi:hypothetical protein